MIQYRMNAFAISIRNPYEINFKQIALLSAVALQFVLLTIIRSGHIHFSPDIVMGCILSVTNAFLGYVFIERAFRFDSNMFLIVSLAGMVMRFFLMIASLAVFLLTTAMDQGAFIGSFMGSYVLFMSLEIAHINSKIDQLKFKKVRGQ